MQTNSSKKPTYTSAFILLAIGVALTPAIFYLVSFWRTNDQSGLSAAIGFFLFSIPSFLSGVLLLASIGKFISVWHERKFYSSLQGMNGENLTQESAELTSLRVRQKLQNNYIASWILLILLIPASVGVFSFSISRGISLSDMSIINMVFIAIVVLVMGSLVFCIVKTTVSIHSLRTKLKKNLLTVEDMK